jgi:peptidyl-prolyl cis-trans isomerase D
MALFNTLRNKMGKLVVGVIFFSTAAFVGADLLGPNSAILGGNNTDVGEIAGKTISHQDYVNKIDEMAVNFRINAQRNPSSEEMVSVRNQAWDGLINDIAYQSQFNNIGIGVTNDEVIDMVQGNNISPDIKQAFTNPETGQFDRQQVVTFLQGLNDVTPAQRANWLSFEQNLAPARTRTKYENLIIKTNYASLEEGKQLYYYTAAAADVKYVYVPFNSIVDTTIAVTDSELQTFIDNNEDQFQREESRNLKYVSINITPSEKDTAVVLEDINLIKENLMTAEDDSTFAIINSDGNFPYITYNRDGIPEQLIEEDEVVEEETVVGPFFENNKYVVYKLSGVEEGTTNSARASHILFKWDDDSDAAKAKTKLEANKVLLQIRNGADFAEMARIHGTDGTASVGGDLGWFSDGKMVPAFQEVVFKATRKGLLRTVVETQFGYHIIDVTETVTNLSYKVTKIELELYVSDETRNIFYRNAETFALNSNDIESFEQTAKESGYEISEANQIKKNDRRVSNLQNARGIVTWLFNTGEVNGISEVFELDNEYIIAVMTEQQDKGAASLEVVRNQVERKVRDVKKANQIIAKLSNADGALDEIAETYGDAAQVIDMSNLKLSGNTLNTVGLAPEAVGLAFSMENGEKTKPFKVDNGVLVLELVNKTDPADISDYESYRAQVEQKRQGRIPYNINETVKELAKIEDLRYKFF